MAKEKRNSGANTWEKLIQNLYEFPAKCRDIICLADEIELRQVDTIRSVFFRGMGSSAIPGLLAREFIRTGIHVDLSPRPTLQLHERPALLIAVSYSGNSMEPVVAARSAFALQDDFLTLSVTSNGKLKRLAKTNGGGILRLPLNRKPSETMCWASVGVLRVLQRMHCLADPYLRAGDALFADIEALEYRTLHKNATRLAAAIQDRIPYVLWADSLSAVAAIHWHSQLDENAHILAHSDALSNALHSPFVALMSGDMIPRTVVLLLASSTYAPAYKAAYDGFCAALRNQGISVEIVHSQGSSHLARILSLLWQGEMLSYITAQSRGIERYISPAQLHAEKGIRYD